MKTKNMKTGGTSLEVNKGHENSQQDWIIGLKGIGAIVIACFFHYYWHFDPENYPVKLLNPLFLYGGEIFTCVFYLLSGLGIEYGYERRIYDEEISFEDYYKKRFLKIYPLHLVTLILVTILQAVYGKLRGGGETFVYQNFDVYHFLLNLFCLQKGFVDRGFSFNGPSWFLSMILAMYAVYFLIVVIFKKRIKRNGYFYVYVVLALIGLCVIGKGLDSQITIAFWGKALFFFFLGGAIAKIHFCIENNLLCGYMSIFIAGVSGISLFLGISGDERMVAWIGVVPAVVFIPMSLAWVQRILSLNVFVYLGKYSMGIYLVHFSVQILFEILNMLLNLQLDYSSVWIWLIYCISVIVCAVGLQKIISKISYM